jgi:hypothetical protein
MNLLRPKWVVTFKEGGFSGLFQGINTAFVFIMRKTKKTLGNPMRPTLNEIQEDLICDCEKCDIP